MVGDPGARRKITPLSPKRSQSQDLKEDGRKMPSDPRVVQTVRVRVSIHRRMGQRKRERIFPIHSYDINKMMEVFR